MLQGNPEMAGQGGNPGGGGRSGWMSWPNVRRSLAKGGFGTREGLLRGHTQNQTLFASRERIRDEYDFSRFVCVVGAPGQRQPATSPKINRRA